MAGNVPPSPGPANRAGAMSTRVTEYRSYRRLPALAAALARHAADTNPLVDAPSVRVCRFARLEVGDMIDFGKKCVACLVDADARELMAPWLELLDDCLAAASGLHGADAPSGQ